MSDLLTGPSGPASKATRPRGVVKVGGKPISFLSFDVTQKSYFSASTWSVDLECWNQPQGYGLRWWDKAGVTSIDILMGALDPAADVSALPADPQPLLTGQVDTVSADPLTGKLTISGRDLTALFIDTKTANKWPDQTASQIALSLAEEHGLTANVTSTSTPVGQYYNSSYAKITRSIPEWDLLTFLAQQEGFDCYVDGTTLYFGPPQADSDTNPYVVTVGHDGYGRVWSTAETLRLDRALTLAQDLIVTVLSTNIYGGTVKKTAQKGGTGSAQTTSAKAWQKLQNYVIRRPGLSEKQAQKLANSTLEDISKHERTVTVGAEGDVTMSPKRRLRVAGTGTSFDQDYYLDQVIHTYGFHRGYGMTLHGKNHTVVTDLISP